VSGVVKMGWVVAAALVILAVAAGGAPLGGSSLVGVVSPQEAVVRRGDVVCSLRADRAVYGPGDPVRLTFTVADAGGEEVRFRFATTQQVDVIVTRGGVEVARWSLGQVFLREPGGYVLVLHPGQAWVFRASWLQRDWEGRPVPAGDYVVTAVLVAEGAPCSVSLAYRRTGGGDGA
jgi:hypothetical protein